MMSEFAGEATPLDEKSMSEVAEQLGADAVRIWTVIHVETCGCGFLSDRRPNILFERYIFHRLTKGRYDAVAPDLSNADSGGYSAQGAHQYDRLARAMSFDRQAALCSASWGIGQIMGSNAKSAGWADVESMVKAMMQTEGAQLRGMAGFIRHNGLDRALCSKNWTAFARGYNGEAYAKNQYDRRLAAAHEMYRIGPLPDLLVRSAQLYLTYLGYQPGRVEVDRGSGTSGLIGAVSAPADGVHLRSMVGLVGSPARRSTSSSKPLGGRSPTPLMTPRWRQCERRWIHGNRSPSPREIARTATLAACLRKRGTMKWRSVSLAALVFGCLWAETGLASCQASLWQSYRGTELWSFPGSSAYFYKTKRMEIDADGAPNAYHPQDKGIDALGNAGYPNGGWTAVLVQDPQHPSKPYLQPSGEFAGYFLSRTTLQDTTVPPTDPRRYVDARTVPYLVFPEGFYRLKGTGGFGDLGMARNLNGDKETPFVIADAGPPRAPLGEVSIRLAEMLGGKNVNPRTGAGKPSGDFVYVIFPKSKAQPAWPVSADEMQERAGAALAALGGWEKILACVH